MNCLCCNSLNLLFAESCFAPFIVERAVLQSNLTNRVTCEDCGFVFAHYRFTDEEMDRIYRHYRSEEYINDRDAFEPGYRNIKMVIEVDSREKAMQDFLGKIDAARVLDYGGDRGQYIPSMFDTSAKYVYDISNVEPMDGVQKLSELNGSFDFIMLSGVLEHLPDPLAILKMLKNVCSKYIFIAVPAKKDPSSPAPSRFHEHINFFTEKSLNEIVSRAGFNVLKCEKVTMDIGWCQETAHFLLGEVK